MLLLYDELKLGYLRDILKNQGQDCQERLA